MTNEKAVKSARHPHPTVPIWHANGGLRGLPLKAGQYHIELDFRPLSFTLGAVTSILSVLVLLAAFGYQSMVGWTLKR